MLGGCGKEGALQDTQQIDMEVGIAWVGFWLIWVAGGSTRGLLSGAMDILGIVTGVDEMIKSTKVDGDKVSSAPQSSRIQVKSTHLSPGVCQEDLNGVLIPEASGEPEILIQRISQSFMIRPSALTPRHFAHGSCSILS